MRTRCETATIENAFEFARQDLYELQTEMGDAADNMPEQLNKAYAEAAQLLSVALHYVNHCDVPAELCDVEVTWTEWKGKIHRPQRRDNIVNFLSAYLKQVPQNDGNEKLRSSLRDAIEVLKNVFFPGMSGRRFPRMHRRRAA